MEEKEFRMVPPDQNLVLRLLKDLTPEAGYRNAEEIYQSWRLSVDDGGWSGIFLDQQDRPVAFVSGVRLDGLNYTTGLITKTLVRDRRQLVRALKEWKLLLTPGIWRTFLKIDSGLERTEALHLHMGWVREQRQPYPQNLVMKLEV